MRAILSTILIILSTSLSANLYRIRTVTQTGRGTIGKVKIVFTQADYSIDNVVKEYTDNSVELFMHNAFIIPVRRVFKSSSEKSSVAKIIVTQEGGDLAHVSIKFRIPIDIIKQEDSMYTQDNSFVYQYNTKPKLIAATTKEETKVAENNIKQNKVSLINKVKAHKQIKKTTFKKTRYEAPKNNKSLNSWITYILILVGIFFLIISFYTIRKFTVYNNIELRKLEDEYGTVRIIDILKLGFTKKLLVIEVEQKRILLAIYKGKIKLISELGQVYYEDTTQAETPNLFADDNLSSGLEDSVDTFKTRLK